VGSGSLRVFGDSHFLSACAAFFRSSMHAYHACSPPLRTHASMLLLQRSREHAPLQTKLNPKTQPSVALGSSAWIWKGPLPPPPPRGCPAPWNFERRCKPWAAASPPPKAAPAAAAAAAATRLWQQRRRAAAGATARMRKRSWPIGTPTCTTCCRSSPRSARSPQPGSCRCPSSFLRATGASWRRRCCTSTQTPEHAPPRSRSCTKRRRRC